MFVYGLLITIEHGGWTVALFICRQNSFKKSLAIFSSKPVKCGSNDKAAQYLINLLHSLEIWMLTFMLFTDPTSTIPTLINDKSANYLIWAYPFVHVCVVSRTEIQAFLFQQFLIGLLSSNIMRTFFVALALLANFVTNGQGRILQWKKPNIFSWFLCMHKFSLFRVKLCYPSLVIFGLFWYFSGETIFILRRGKTNLAQDGGAPSFYLLIFWPYILERYKWVARAPALQKLKV